MRLKKERAGKILLAVISLLVGLIFLEIGLRQFVPEQNQNESWNSHPVLGYLRDPDFEFCVSSKLEGYSNCFQTDKQGLIIRHGRGDELDVPEDTVSRIMLLGDSMVEGNQVAATANLSILLENMLPESSYVLNLGVGGYSPIRHLLTYNYFKDDFQPDTVILFFTVSNDFTDDARLYHDNRIIFSDDSITPVALKPAFDEDNGTYWTSSNLESPLPHQKVWGSELFGYVRRGWRAFSRFIQDDALKPCDDMSGELTLRCADYLLRDNSLIRNNFAAIYKNSGDFPPEDEEDMQRTRDYVLQLRENVEADGARFLLVLIPDPVIIENQLELTRITARYPDEAPPNPLIYNRVVENFCLENGLTCIDLFPLLDANSDKQLFWKKDIHFSEVSHQLIAEYLADYLTGHVQSAP